MTNGKSKKSKKKLIIFGGLGILVIALVLIAIFGSNNEKIIQVQTEKVNKRNITQTVTGTGNLDPKHKVVITPQITGEIGELPVKEGDYFHKGELLIKIKQDYYIAQRDQAQANLEVAQANLSMKQANLEKLTANFKRVRKLHEKKLTSDSNLEAARSSYLSAKAAYEGGMAQVSTARAALNQQVDQLSKTVIHSPMNGTVTKLNVELGERVLGSGFSQGTNLMTISDLPSMEAVVDVDENDVILVALGDTADVKIDAFGDKVFKAIVTQIGNSAITSGMGTQAQVVNFEVKLKFLKFNTEFRPGMSCSANIQTETKRNILSVPIQSVTARNEPIRSKKKGGHRGSKNFQGNNNKLREVVFVVKNGIAKAVKVTTGISNDNYIETKSGLKEGEVVVTGPYRAISRELRDGSKVRVEKKMKSLTIK